MKLALWMRLHFWSMNYAFKLCLPCNGAAGIELKISKNLVTGKSFSEALFLAKTNPQYDKRLIIDLPVQ